MSSLPFPFSERALADAHLTLEELDRLHTAVVMLMTQLTTVRLAYAALNDLLGQLAALELITRRVLEWAYAPLLHYGANGQLQACPACGSLRVTYLHAPQRRACCQECGLPCDLYPTS
jgi:hypothetical protein